ncbi:MAG: SIMPL domain-containing protein [Helicobacteraceae bacterium]|jgi:hypothetical protein|nr:SIMPL domain-containing protein [Helicobacteraceae bacterium]
MQTKSAIILGVSFVIGLSIEAAISKWDVYDYSNVHVSVAADKRVTLKEGEEVSPGVLSEMFERAREQAEAIARASGKKLGAPADVYSNVNGSYQYSEEPQEDGKREVTINLSATFDMK